MALRPQLVFSCKRIFFFPGLCSQELAKELGLQDINKGLTEEQVLENRRRYGPNVLEKDKSEPVWRIFLQQFLSPVVMLLLVAAIASMALQEWVEGAAILIIVTLNATLATYMEKSGTRFSYRDQGTGNPHIAITVAAVHVDVMSLGRHTSPSSVARRCSAWC